MLGMEYNYRTQSHLKEKTPCIQKQHLQVQAIPFFKHQRENQKALKIEF